MSRSVRRYGTRTASECTVSVNRPGLGPGSSRFDSCHSDVVQIAGKDDRVLCGGSGLIATGYHNLVA